MVVACGVSYDSDLVLVEAVRLEVMRTVLQEHPGAEPESEPTFRYEAFGESNIDFYMVIRARNRLAGFAVRSELIKKLHSRLAAEGITINYPVRTLRLPDGWTPRDGPPLLPQVSESPSPESPSPAIIPSPGPLAGDPSAAGGDGSRPGRRSPGGPTLPIVLEPPDPGEFLEALLLTKEAWIEVSYQDAHREVRRWDAARMTPSSNVIGNLRSRPEFRAGEWQRRGITGILVRLTP